MQKREAYYFLKENKDGFTLNDFIKKEITIEDAFGFITDLCKSGCIKEGEKGRFTLCRNWDEVFEIWQNEYATGDDIDTFDAFYAGGVTFSVRLEGQSHLGIDVNILSKESIIEVVDRVKDEYDLRSLFIEPYGFERYENGASIADIFGFAELITEAGNIAIELNQPICKSTKVHDLFYAQKDIVFVVGLICEAE